MRDLKKEFNFVGRNIADDRSYGKVTGQVRYCCDEKLHGMLYIKLKPSTVAHGLIKSIDVSSALAVEGVVAIYTYKNTPNKRYDRGRVAPWENVPKQECLFDRHIRFMGERVAAVVAISEEIAEYSCRLIDVKYELLPAVVSVTDAERADAPKLHEDGNVYETAPFNYGDYDAADGLRHRSRSHIGRMTHLCMETQSCVADYNQNNGMLTVWTGCQSVFGVRSTVAELLGLPCSKVRVIKAPMGGSFGVKQETLIEPLTAFVSYMQKRPARLVYTREEQIVNTMMKHSLDAELESKVSADGMIHGISFSCTLDAGAYLTVSKDYANTIGGKINKVYRIPNIHFDGRAVCTNTPINGSYRSWGSCEMALCIENHWNMVAQELGLDPIEFRLKNIHQPYDTEVCHNASIGKTHFEECLRMGRDGFQWDKRKAECSKKNASQKRYRYGVGMALTSHTSSFYPYRVDVASTSAGFQEDGSLVVHAPVHDHGCGTVWALKKIAAEVTGVSLEKITLEEADTENCRYDHGCYASRTIYSLGMSVKTCCEKLMDLAQKRAASLLGCNEKFLRYDNGIFYQEINRNVSATLRKVCEYSIRVVGSDLFCSETTNASASPGVPAAHFTHVEVDTYTGFVKVLHCLSVHDVGKAINPSMCIGQVGSGIQQGLGMAICEEIKVHPKSGETLITNFKNYDVVNSVDMPDYDVILIEDDEPSGPFGAKSIGEVVLPPVAPAVVAAVNNAIGTQLWHLPLTPAVILEALEAKQQ